MTETSGELDFETWMFERSAAMTDDEREALRRKRRLRGPRPRPEARGLAGRPVKISGTRPDYPCTKCKARHPADELDDFTGLCPTCRDDGPKVISKRHCEICGKPVSGYANRKTCGDAHRKQRQRLIKAGRTLPYPQDAAS
jgi:Zn finger protein HypA/HybF involved in hydrogenase expression